MIAPITLVAANDIDNNISEVRIVPRIPIINAENAGHLQRVSSDLSLFFVPTKASARYTTAIPNTTHKNAGVTVITAEKVRNAVIIPMIMLATTAIPVQSILHPQFEFDIIFHLRYTICRKNGRSENLFHKIRKIIIRKPPHLFKHKEVAFNSVKIY